MRLKFLYFLGVFFFVNAHVIMAQITVQVGSGISNTPCYFPVFSTGNLSTTITNVRSNVLWTRAELLAAGIPAEATIISVEFNRSVGGTFTTVFTNPVTHKLYMANTNNDTNLVLGSPWSGILATHTLVDSNASFNVPGVSGWVKWNITPFLYTGGALEIAAELITPANNLCCGNSGIRWQRANGIAQAGTSVIAQTGAGSAPEFLDATNSTYIAKPNIRITYVTCAAPALPVIDSVTSNSAAISWNRVNGATGYEYAITNSVAPPDTGRATTDTSCNEPGLSSGTLYYVHVRTRCGTNFSSWTRDSFFTEGCYPPSLTASISGDSVGIYWNPITGAAAYQYAISGSIITPSAGTATTDTNFHVRDLAGATTYYAYVRTDCGTGGFSLWNIVSFTTPCFAPSPFVIIATPEGNATISWRKVNGATIYEYAVLTEEAPPAWGSAGRTVDTVVQLSGLIPGLKYYFHIRCQCRQNKLSDWATLEFHPTGIETYPNPVRDNLTIKVYGDNINSGWISILDATGRLMKKLPLTSNTTTINMGLFAPGIYMLRYDGREGYVTRVVKL